MCAICRNPPTSHNRTHKPAVALRESGGSRTAWFTGDIERTSWLTGHGDLLRLLHNAIRWITHDTSMALVDGPGLIEMFCWETSPRYTVHVPNYSNPDAQHGWLQSTVPLGLQQIAMKFPVSIGVKSVEFLNAETIVPHHLEDQVLHFSIPTIKDYEIAAITIS